MQGHLLELTDDFIEVVDCASATTGAAESGSLCIDADLLNELSALSDLLLRLVDSASLTTISLKASCRASAHC